MAAATIAYQNLADAGMVSATSEQITLPATNVQTADIARRWRSVEAGAAALILDLGSSKALDTVAVMGTTMSAAGTARVRVSSIDTSGLSGDIHDSGALAVSATYGQVVHLIAAPVTGRYVRIDFVDPDAAYIEAGRLLVAPRKQFAINFAYNWQVTTTDRSIISKSRGGQTLVWQDNLYRTVELPFEQIVESDRHDFIETIERANGAHSDVLLTVDPASADLARDSVWGLIVGSTPIVNPSPDRFSKQYKIEERL